MGSRVVLREFSSRAEAEIVRELLHAGEIESAIVSDDFGAVGPALQFGRGVFLLVSEDDLERALGVLADALSDTAGEEAPE